MSVNLGYYGTENRLLTEKKKKKKKYIPFYRLSVIIKI